MRCPYCGHTEDRVVDSRESREGEVIRRRRECIRCERRFTSYEKIESMPFQVVKRDERREPYDREKLMNGLRIACKKRPVSQATLEALADEIEAAMQDSADREISSNELGNMVMSRLRQLDQVAYVRFASVYRRFEDVEEFLKELTQLRDQGS
ncbi:MAG TPA: transcriptional regulator NrdR [Thermoanaerobaculia bacterium]